MTGNPDPQAIGARGDGTTLRVSHRAACGILTVLRNPGTSSEIARAKAPPFPIQLPFDPGDHPPGTRLPPRASAAVRRAITDAVNETDEGATRRLLDRITAFLTHGSSKPYPIDLTWSELARAAGGGTNIAPMLILADAMGHCFVEAQALHVIEPPSTGRPGRIALLWDEPCLTLEGPELELDARYPDTVVDALPGRRLAEIVDGLPETLANRTVLAATNRFKTVLSIEVSPDIVDLRDMRAEDCLPIM